MQQLLARFKLYLLAERRFSKHTVAAYCADVMFWSQLLAADNQDLQTVSAQKLLELVQTERIKGNSGATLARKIASLRHWYKWAALRLGWENRSYLLKTPRLRKTLPQVLSEQEVINLCEAARNATGVFAHRNQQIILLLLFSGMRVSEITQLKLIDLDVQSNTVRITGKRGTQRVVPLIAELVDSLLQFIEGERAQLVERYGYQEYLFLTQYQNAARPLSRQAVWKIVQYTWKQSGARRKIWPHLLRHSYATQLLKNGADLRSLQTLLGHAHINTVTRYTHLDTNYLRLVYEKKHPRA